MADLGNWGARRIDLHLSLPARVQSDNWDGLRAVALSSSHFFPLRLPSAVLAPLHDALSHEVTGGNHAEAQRTLRKNGKKDEIPCAATIR